MTINVKSVDSIGVLVDGILKKEGITLKSFEWKAEKVNNILKYRSQAHMKMRSHKECNKEKVYANNWVYNWEE
jgi:hypothetical protein